MFFFVPGFGKRSLFGFGPVLYNSGAIFSTFGEEGKVWSNFNDNHHRKFCKSTNFVNIQPNFLSARKRKDQPLRLVWTERKILSVLAYSMYSIYTKHEIKSFVILDLLRRSVYRVCGAYLRVTAPEQQSFF